MTQNTQTTAERIESILRRDLDVDVIVSRGGDPHYNEADIVGVNIAAQAIAAEIDALTRERDEARAELAGLDAGMRFQFDRAEDYKAQRDEARAEVARLTPLSEIHHEGPESPSEESVVRFIEFAHAAAGRAYEAAKGTP
jgi:hypothetical protein